MFSRSCLALRSARFVAVRPRRVLLLSHSLSTSAARRAPADQDADASENDKNLETEQNEAMGAEDFDADDIPDGLLPVFDTHNTFLGFSDEAQDVHRDGKLIGKVDVEGVLITPDGRRIQTTTEDGEGLSDDSALDGPRAAIAKPYRTWMRETGERFKHAEEQLWFGDGRPFPMNTSFVPPPPLSDALRDRIWEQYMADPYLNGVRDLAQRYSLSLSRVEAILRLKGLEHNWIQGQQLQTSFSAGMEHFLGVEQDGRLLKSEPNTKSTGINKEEPYTDEQAEDIHLTELMSAYHQLNVRERDALDSQLNEEQKIVVNGLASDLADLVPAVEAEHAGDVRKEKVAVVLDLLVKGPKYLTEEELEQWYDKDALQKYFEVEDEDEDGDEVANEKDEEAVSSRKARESDELEEERGRQEARDRYERHFWEPVYEMGQPPIVPKALERAQATAIRAATREATKSGDPKLALKVKVPSYVLKPSPIQRISKVGRPDLKFVDVGTRFLDDDEVTRRYNEAERRKRTKKRWADEVD